ncbi:MAG TPA: flagellar protein FlaG [Bacillales bacterium]|nr:flagellar protein FlaG [Bacillales bacterium]
MDVAGVSTGNQPLIFLMNASRSNENNQKLRESQGEAKASKLKPGNAFESRSSREAVKPARSHIQYVYHRKTGMYFIQMINNRTSEVIREIPPKKVLDMYASMVERFGIFVNERR